MRIALLPMLCAAVVLAGCTSNRVRHVSYANTASPSTQGTIVRVSEVYSDPGSAGTIVRESAVYSDPAPAVRVAAFRPPPAPALPRVEPKPVVCTPVVPTARPARPVRPARSICLPIPKPRVCPPPPACDPCPGGNCGVPSLDDCCPGGNCGIPSIDVCLPPLKLDPCGK